MSQDSRSFVRWRWVATAVGAASLLFLASLPLRARESRRTEPEIDVRQILSERRLPACPDFANCVSSQADDPKRFVEPLTFEGDGEAALERLRTVLHQRQSSDLLRDHDGLIHVADRTPLLGFVDDVLFLLRPDARRIEVRSASRVGQGDLGTNRRRVEALREAFHAEAR
ncbi:MAG: DUF1499 domain-containing protein [Acidobacteriota bacterium]